MRRIVYAVKRYLSVFANENGSLRAKGNTIPAFVALRGRFVLCRGLWQGEGGAGEGARDKELGIRSYSMIKAYLKKPMKSMKIWLFGNRTKIYEGLLKGAVMIEGSLGRIKS